MDEFVGLLFTLALGLLGAGPLAILLTIILFKKLGKLERRLHCIENVLTADANPARYMSGAQTKSPAAESQQAPAQKESVTQPVSTFEARKECPQEQPVTQPQAVIKDVPAPPAVAVKTIEPVIAAAPLMPAAASSGAPAAGYYQTSSHQRPHAVQSGLELKIGTRVILIAGIITVIFGVGFFLKFVYQRGYFSPAARVALVAAGGFAAIIIGDVLRRKQFEIVAKGITALGFALLYAAIFSGSRVYGLFSTELAFAFSIAVTASAMAYAVVLNEILIAFLALLGGYLAPAIISTGQNLPNPLFGYVLVLSAGAMGCAMFRRWRAVNWIAMAGTWLLYTAWFEKFYTDGQLTIALGWLCVFACLYLILPVLYGLVRRVEARAEDVVLVVINSIVVFAYLWRLLNSDDRSGLTIGTAALGAMHLAVMFAAIWRCRQDIKLQTSLGVLGVSLLTAAIPMYFDLNAALTGWSIEAIALTYIGLRYRSLWTQTMAIIAAGLSAGGLFYHLPLHADGVFRVFLNSSFGTWVLVSAGLIVCHLLWRFMIGVKDRQGSFASQAFYAAGTLLLAAGIAIEWHSHCGWHMLYDPLGQASFLKGMMILATLLIPAFIAKPISPRGEITRSFNIAVTVFGCAFISIAMMGSYYDAFKLFINVPFGLAIIFLAVLFWAGRQYNHSKWASEKSKQIGSAFILLGLILLLVVLTEQMYLYWACRNEYGAFTGDWKAKVLQYTLVTWAVYGLLLLYGGIRFDKSYAQQTSFLVTAMSAIGLFFLLPLHNSSEFKVAYNAPFITWVIVCTAMLLGHGLWRFMAAANNDSKCLAQFYYTAGLSMLALGAGLEWACHCRWHIEVAGVADSHLYLGLIMLAALIVQGFFARPLSPEGSLVTGAGIITVLSGCVFIVFAMPEVYYNEFKLFLNWPFVIAMSFASSVLVGAWFMRKSSQLPRDVRGTPAAMMLSALVLVWIVLSQQVYYFWYCKNTYGSVEIANWSFSAQMYMSVAWAIYGAVLMMVGFARRNESVRWLSLLIFGVLLVKIFVVDTSALRAEYRIAAFITTGLVLVGVSFLYQLLKNRGFFETAENENKLPK